MGSTVGAVTAAATIGSSTSRLAGLGGVAIARNVLYTHVGSRYGATCPASAQTWVIGCCCEGVARPGRGEPGAETVPQIVIKLKHT